MKSESDTVVRAFAIKRQPGRSFIVKLKVAMSMQMKAKEREYQNENAT